jgi:hypothetical protein
MKTLPNSDDCSESRMNISVLASIHAVGRFLLVLAPFWMQEKSAKFVHFIGGFRNNVQDQRRLSKQLF